MGDILRIKMVAGSQAEPYEVELVRQDNGVAVFCNCRAGEMSRFCKHKAAVVAFDDTLLADPRGDLGAWQQVPDWLAGSSLPAEFDKLSVAMKEGSANTDEIQRIKRRIARKMAGGG